MRGISRRVGGEPHGRGRTAGALERVVRTNACGRTGRRRSPRRVPRPTPLTPVSCSDVHCVFITCAYNSTKTEACLANQRVLPRLGWILGGCKHAVFYEGLDRFLGGAQRHYKSAYAMEHCVKGLRPHFVSLVESNILPDNMTPSTIGNYYGDIYENQLEMAQKSRLNKREVPEYFE